MECCPLKEEEEEGAAPRASLMGKEITVAAAAAAECLPTSRIVRQRRASYFSRRAKGKQLPRRRHDWQQSKVPQSGHLVQKQDQAAP